MMQFDLREFLVGLKQNEFSELDELLCCLATSQDNIKRLVSYAVETGAVRVLEWLTKNDGKVAKKCVMDKTNKHLAWKATYHGNLAVLQFLVQHGFAWDSRACATEAMKQRSKYQIMNNYKDNAETKKREALCEWTLKF